MLHNFTVAAAAQQSPPAMVIFLLYGLMFAGLYFLLIRPNSKRKKAEAELRNNITIGDEITTIGGIVGRIVAIKESTDTLILETGTDRSRIIITRWAVASINKKTNDE